MTSSTSGTTMSMTPSGCNNERESSTPESSHKKKIRFDDTVQILQPHSKDTNVEFFRRRQDDLKRRWHEYSKCMVNDNKSSLEASYRVSYRIAIAGEAHSIGEKLIKPCAKDLIICKIGEKFAKEIDCVPLSGTTVTRQIKDLADYCEKELVNRLQTSPHGYTLQIDESTDVSGLGVLIVLVRYVFDSSIYEDLLLCTPLQNKTNGEKIFDIINTYMRKHQIYWDSCSHVCVDPTKSNLGASKGVISKIKSVAGHVKHSHCFLHRYAFTTKGMSKELKEVLDNVIKIINYIKTKDSNSRLLKLLSEDLSPEQKTILLRTDSRWVSRGKVLGRFYELKDVIRIFLIEYKYDLANKLSDEIWLQSMAYLADIFSIINEMNVSLQETTTNILKQNDKVQAMVAKLDLWRKCVQKNDLQCFHKLNDFLTSVEHSLNSNIQKLILEHLSTIQKNFKEYFPSSNLPYAWIQNPFQSLDLDCSDVPLKEKEQVIELSKDSTCKAKFDPVELLNFWLNMSKDYPDVSDRAIKTLMPFVSTYSCERAFSAYVTAKTKYKSSLDAEPQIRLQISSITPDMEEICKQKLSPPT